MTRCRPLALTAGLAARVIAEDPAERKTQTRRPVDLRAPWQIEESERGPWPYDPHWSHGDPGSPWARPPLGEVGDLLWLREPAQMVAIRGGEAEIVYGADGASRVVPWPDRLRPVPSGHGLANGVHREGSRATLRIERVWVQRLRDITEEEARAEGFDPAPVHGEWAGPREAGGHWSARKPLAETWGRIYRRRGLGWDANPWVWAYELELLEVKR